MRTWSKVWGYRNAFLPKIQPFASYSTKFNPAIQSSSCAILTIVHNEHELLPLWLKYYLKHVEHPSNIFILDHLTTDNSTHPSKIPKGVNLKMLKGNRFAMPVVFRSWQVNKYQDRLIRAGFKCIVFTDTDEIVAPNPNIYPAGLKEYMTKFISNPKAGLYRVTAIEVGHMSYGNGSLVTQEPPLDWNKPILSQRSYFRRDKVYNKPLITKYTLRYKPGFHHLFQSKRIETDGELFMLHLRSFDHTFCMKRELAKFNLTKFMKPEELSRGYAMHWRYFEKRKKSGELCQFASLCFTGPMLGSNTHIMDGTYTVEMEKFNGNWSNII
jgi:hypothetical protein